MDDKPVYIDHHEYAGNQSPCKAACVSRLSNLRTPQRQQPITFCVAVLKCGTFPFLSASSMSAHTHTV